MKIIFDSQTTKIQKSGFGFYTQNLIKNLKGLDSKIEIVEVSPEENGDLSTLKRVIWDQWGFLKKTNSIKADLIHKPCFSAPIFSQKKVVVTIHDLIPNLFPQNLSSPARLYWTKLLPFSLKFADHLITISEASKKDILRICKIAPDKITVIPEAAGEEYYPMQSKTDLDKIKQIKEKYEIGNNEYILSVCTLEPRKNLPFLVEAFSMALKKNPELNIRLVLTGKKGWYYEEIFLKIKELGLEDKVVFTGYVEDDDMPFLYNGAKLFAFPSLYEGFGLPPLEAMACGVPAICSNASSLPEVCGDAAVLLAPNNLEDWAKSIGGFLTNNELLREYHDKSIVQSKKFSWKITAEKTLEVYKQVLGK